jgi:hypothetical protein
MSQISVQMGIEDIERLLPQLSKAEILELNKKIREYLETKMMKKAAETGFTE